jgi:hypothetical protein
MRDQHFKHVQDLLKEWRQWQIFLPESFNACLRNYFVAVHTATRFLDADGVLNESEQLPLDEAYKDIIKESRKGIGTDKLTKETLNAIRKERLGLKAATRLL